MGAFQMHFIQMHFIQMTIRQQKYLFDALTSFNLLILNESCGDTINF